MWSAGRGRMQSREGVSSMEWDILEGVEALPGCFQDSAGHGMAGARRHGFDILAATTDLGSVLAGRHRRAGCCAHARQKRGYCRDIAL